MPKASKATSTARPSTRRSSRLSKKDLKDVNAIVVGQPSKPKRKTAVSDTNASLCTNDDSASVAKPHAIPDLRRSLRITPAELIRREKALLKEEQECKRRTIELDERASSLLKKETEAALILSQMAEREAEVSLAQLEEHFTCALCYEIMAHPYALNPGQCGHTFCAICILKWFFSRLHTHCGAWHESVDCPICRSLLVITPDRVPRPDTTFPFVPNRTAAAVCESLIERLSNTSSGALIVKREDSEGAWGWTSGCNRKKDGSKEADEKAKEIADETADVASWREGGFMRTEWLKKDREGKKEMNRISKEWPTLTSQDFRNLKQKLGV